MLSTVCTECLAENGERRKDGKERINIRGDDISALRCPYNLDTHRFSLIFYRQKVVLLSLVLLL